MTSKMVLFEIWDFHFKGAKTQISREQKYVLHKTKRPDEEFHQVFLQNNIENTKASIEKLL